MSCLLLFLLDIKIKDDRTKKSSPGATSGLNLTYPPSMVTTSPVAVTLQL